MAYASEQSIEERESTTQRIINPLGVVTRRFFVFVSPTQDEPMLPSPKKAKNKPQFGSAKDLIEISDDFNNPLDEFEGYM